MRYKIVAVKDRAADVFAVPQFVVNVGAAVRAFGDEVNRPHSDERPNVLNQHPADFELYLLGEYDDETAEFSLERAKQLAIASDYVRS